MSIVASMLSIVLFLAFVTAGAQRVQFNPMIAAMAQRLGLSKSAFRRLGVVEIVGGIALLIGLASARGSFFGIVNEAAGAGLALLMLGVVAVHVRKGDGLKEIAPALALCLLALVEVFCRLG